MRKACEELRELLGAWRDGELSPDDARRVAAHVAECDDCSAALASDAEIDAILAESVVPRTSADWDALTRRTERAIADDATPRPRRAEPGRWRRFFPGLTPRRLAFGSAGTIAVALLVFLLQPAMRTELAENAGAPPAELAREVTFGRAADDFAAAPESDAPAPAAEPAPAKEEEAAPAPGVHLAGDGRTDRAKGAPHPEALAKSRVALGEAGSAELVERDAASAEGREVLGVERFDALEVTVTSPPPEPAERRLRTGGPQVTPAPPAGGARSIDEVAAWLEPGPKSSARIAAEDAAPPPAPAIVERALSRASALVSQGQTDRAREGLVLLTGDFAGNTRREEAWAALLRLDADVALRSPRVDTILPIARSIDAFLEAYPGHADAEAVRDRQVRVWARLATIDPTYCAAALERAAAWEASLGNWVPFETRMVVARMRDGPCSE